MTIDHLILRYAHISMGTLALLSGAAAMTFRKGSRLHRQSGNVFFVSVLIVAATGVYISIFITPTMGNVMGGAMTSYLTATAWLTVWRKPAEVGLLEIVLVFLGLATAIAGITFGVLAAHRRGFTGSARLTRHLSRMCFAFFIATGSFFFGQAKLFPAPVRESGLLAIPALLPFALLLFWVIRIRGLPMIKKSWTPRVVRQAS
ncbi:MAG: DUF2306 domain-containing protein [Gemmatimonadaceae bacterium]